MQKLKFKKVLFLDIDGVLNYEHWWEKWQSKYHKPFKYMLPADPEKVKLIGLIKKKTGCKVVMISSWRNSWLELSGKEAVKKYGKTELETWRLRKLFNKYNIKFTDPWSLCPYYGYGYRDEEIADYVAEHHVEKWVTLDDMKYNDPGLILIRGCKGLTKEQAYEAIKRLNEI